MTHAGPDRRRFLGILAVGTIGALAGCLTPNGDDDTDPDDDRPTPGY